MTSTSTDARPLSFEAGSAGPVSGLLLRPPSARALYVLAHGAGAGMQHHFMEDVANTLAGRRVATFRYQFPYVEAGRRRPDPPWVLQRTVRAAVEAAGEASPGLPMVAGGKSLGGRMTSSAVAAASDPASPLRHLRGLIFLGFPLHAPGREGTERAAHLADVPQPMLFLQGTRDNLAKLSLIEEVTGSLGERATLHVVDGADHSFAVLKRSGRTNEEVIAELGDAIEGWLTGRSGPGLSPAPPGSPRGGRRSSSP